MLLFLFLQMCNEWAIDTPCPVGGRDFCRSLHILDSRGNSVLVRPFFICSTCVQESACNFISPLIFINFEYRRVVHIYIYKYKKISIFYIYVYFFLLLEGVLLVFNSTYFISKLNITEVIKKKT